MIICLPPARSSTFRHFWRRRTREPTGTMLVKRTLLQPKLMPRVDVLHPHDLGGQHGEEGQGQVAVGDGGAEFLRGALDIDVDPLVIARRLGELVDLALRDLVPGRDAYLGSDEGFEIFELDKAHGGLFSWVRRRCRPYCAENQCASHVRTRISTGVRTGIWPKPLWRDACHRSCHGRTESMSGAHAAIRWAG